MFQSISIVATIVCLVLAVPLYLAGRRRARSGEREKIIPPVRYLLWDRFMYGLVLVCGGGLAVTGLLLAGFLGHSMDGFNLMLHVGLGGLFTICLVAWVIWWAERGRGTPVSGSVATALRLLFWWLAVTGLGAGATALLAMTPLCGTDGQLMLYELHRYSGLLWFVGIVWHVSLTASARRRH